VNTALRAIEDGSAGDGPPRACLIVLDAGQFSTRCRCCRWRSPSCPALTDAQTAFLTHVCPPARSMIGRERQRCQAPLRVGANDESGGTCATGLAAAMGGEVDALIAGRGRAASPGGDPPARSRPLTCLATGCPSRAGGWELPC
jgi:hypothetical protein